MIMSSLAAAAAFAPMVFCTTNGPMHVSLTDTRFQASYVIDHTGDHGVVVAGRRGHVVDGTWYEPAIGNPELEPAKRAHGPFKLYFSKDMKSFTAAWEMKEGSGSWYPWLGRQREVIDPQSQDDKQFRCA